MSINWDEIDKYIDEAAADTDAKLSSRISSLTRMKDAEIEELFPEPSDKRKLVKLMQIVEEASADNSKIVRLIDNISELSGTIVKLLARFV
jgi:uncharacterized protein (DUF1810 family)